MGGLGAWQSFAKPPAAHGKALPWAAWVLGKALPSPPPHMAKLCQAPRPPLFPENQKSRKPEIQKTRNLLEARG